MKSLKQVVLQAEVALNALDLSVVTQADRERLSKVRLGLHALDDEQADAKGIVDRLRNALKEWEKNWKPTWGACLCAKIPKIDRPCVVCSARAQWFEDRGLAVPPR